MATQSLIMQPLTLSGILGGDSRMHYWPGSVAAPVPYGYTVPAGHYAEIQRINLYIQGGKMDPNEYGDQTALTNGILCKLVDADYNELLNLFPIPVKHNIEYGLYAGVDARIVNANTNGALQVRWTLSKALGEPFLMKSGEKLLMYVQDDISALSEQEAMIQGKLYRNWRD